MWIMFNDAFLSIVDPDGAYSGGKGPSGDKLLVRARIAGDIEAVFPRARVTKTPERDYLFRALVSREDVCKALVERTCSLDYKNFKGSVPDQKRHEAYAGVWGVMHRLQEKLRGAGRRVSDSFI